MSNAKDKTLLTAKRLRELLHYNKRTGVMTWISAPKYHPRMLWKQAGSKRKSRGKMYVWVKVEGGGYSLSRLAFLWVTGNWPKNDVDHKNGDSLDNRWCNLRQATKTQNAWNHKTRKKTTNLPMGIRELKSGKFEARIAKNKVTYHLGNFDSAKAASSVYKQYRKLFFGEFA